jgi:hypothetical protein
LLRNAITSTSAHKGNVERSELMNYLRTQNDAFDNQARILIDSALADSLSEKPDERNSIQVRSMTLMIRGLPRFGARSTSFRLVNTSYF